MRSAIGRRAVAIGTRQRQESGTPHLWLDTSASVRVAPPAAWLRGHRHLGVHAPAPGSWLAAELRLDACSCPRLPKATHQSVVGRAIGHKSSGLQRPELVGIRRADHQPATPPPLTAAHAQCTRQHRAAPMANHPAQPAANHAPRAPRCGAGRSPVIVQGTAAQVGTDAQLGAYRRRGRNPDLSCRRLKRSSSPTIYRRHLLQSSSCSYICSDSRLLPLLGPRTPGVSFRDLVVAIKQGPVLPLF